jgi:hypothetical protein
MTPDLTTLTRFGILEGEAGSRTQSEPKQIGNIGVNGEMSWVNRFLKSVSLRSHNLNKQCGFRYLILTALYIQ